MKGADQVLAVARVDAGLAADRAVDLGEQRGRHLHAVQPAQQDGCGKSGKIADHPAAERHDRSGPVDAMIEQPLQQVAELRHALRCLTGGQDDAATGDAGALQTALQNPEMRCGGEVGVGDDDRIRPAQHRRQLRSGTRQQAAAYHDVVAALAEADGEALVLAHVDAPPACAASASSTRLTTSPTGALLLSTIRSASA